MNETHRQILGFVAFSLIMLLTFWFIYIFMKKCIAKIKFEKNWEKRRREFFSKTFIAESKV